MNYVSKWISLQKLVDVAYTIIAICIQRKSINIIEIPSTSWHIKGDQMKACSCITIENFLLIYHLFLCPSFVNFAKYM